LEFCLIKWEFLDVLCLKTLDSFTKLCKEMVDLAKQAFSTNNFCLAAEIYERTIRENGPNAELFLGLADSLARVGQFSKAFNAYTNAYRYGQVTPGKLKHLVIGLIQTVKQDLVSSGVHEEKQQSCMFTCGVCRGLLADPVTLPCGHTFCRNCLEKDKSKPCEICNTVHYRLKLKNIKTNVVLANLVQKLFPNQCNASVLKKEGNEHFAKRDYINAIESYTKAICIVPSDHLLLSNRCTAYGCLDKFTEALGDAEQVVHLRPDWPKGYFRKGTSLYGLGKYEDAAVAFLQCLSLDDKVSSAKDYLSKTLDKILSAAPPDDPKAHALAQQNNPSRLQQLIDRNFAKPFLLPDIARTITDLAQIVKDTLSNAHEFREANEEIGTNGASFNLAQKITEENEALASERVTLKQRSCSLPDCSNVNHEELEKETRPRCYSPISKRRKRMRHPTSLLEPVSPSQSSPHKVWKSNSSIPAADQNLSSVESNHLVTEDMECSLCYRLYFEPVTTPCGHTFCRKCLDRCLDHTSSCPMCKGNLAEYLAERRKTITEAIQNIIDTHFKEEAKERLKLHDEEMVELAKMGSDKKSEIPVFVCSLTFPTLSCPLHIFEPRYRLMVRQCMESGTRQFGMCMQLGEGQSFSDYGCMLEIRDVQYFPDGRSLVDTIGGRRFKVISRGHREGYDTAKVEFISDQAVVAEELQAVLDLQTEVYGMVKHWLQKLPDLMRNRITQQFGQLPDIETALNTRGPAWAWWSLAVLPLDPKIQLALLGMCSVKERLTALKKVLVYMNRRGSR